MNFSESQKNAIDTRDCSLIISAGAGSGKTAVLTERILERICDENDDSNINDFLIVTFSRAAAKELGDRIRKKLIERASLCPDNKKIVRNIALLPLAKIMTINAFCYELVRENFQKLGLSASVRIADEAETGIIREKLMNEVVDEYFENHGDDGAFLTAYEIFSSAKSDSSFISVLLELDKRISNIADREGFFDFAKESYEQIAEGGEFFDTKFGLALKDYIKSISEETQNMLCRIMDTCAQYPVLLEKYYPVIEAEYEFARSVYHACDKGYGELYRVVNGHTLSNFKGRNIPSSFEAPHIKEMVASAKAAAADSFYESVSSLCACSETLLRLAAKDSGMVVSKLLEIVECFEQRLSQKKRDMSILEFSDAERFTLSLLVESFSPFVITPFARSLRDSFKEIYIDEYQDVNPLQDMIFKAISKQCDGGECNRFMVGDVKQSIYRFRGARSEIFMSYRDTFGDIDTDANAKRIFMSDNYRCSRSVIGLTNLLFERLMGVSYAEGDRLNFARSEINQINGKVQLCAFRYDKATAMGLSAPELEASLICKKIKEIVNNPKYKNSDGKMYGYSDIGILARNKSALKVYETVLNTCKIPSSCSFGESFYDKKEVLFCLNILNAIDNPERDIYLAGYMRSFAGGFLDDELAIIRKKYGKMSLYRAVINFAENEKESCCDLSAKCGQFVSTLREYRTFSRGKSADKLLWKLYTDMDILNLCTSPFFTNDGAGAKKNLLKLYQKARDFAKTSFRGIGAFIEYINNSKKSIDEKSERGLTGDCVKLMTIHSSKGLEFPICFVSNLSRAFDKKEQQSRLCFSERLGVAIKLCDTDAVESTESSTGLCSIETPFRKFVVNELDRDMLDEEIRILYVAMTRARDMLILTSSFSKKPESAIKDYVGTGFTGKYSECPSYFSLIMSSLIDQSALSVYYDAAQKPFAPSRFDAENYLECSYFSGEEIREIYDSCVMSETSPEAEREDEGVSRELLTGVCEMSSHTYKASDIPSKITVSYLKKGLIDEQAEAEASKPQKEQMNGDISDDGREPLPLFVTGEKKADGAERGTAMHLFMQFADYGKCEADCVCEAQRLVDEGFIDARQRELLDFERLKSFFESDFYKEISQSEKVYREQRFNLDLSSLEEGAFADTLVQGVVDLFYENRDGSYTVVDFKTDRVFGDDAEKVLTDRHRDQLMYYKTAVEEMTGKPVRDVIIYSFSLMREIDVI